MHKLNLLKPCLFAIVAFSFNTLFADDPVKPPKDEEVQVTTEVIGLTEKQMLVRQKARIDEEIEELAQVVEKNITKESKDEVLAKFSTYVGAIHTLYARGFDSSWIEFEDGSSWKIRWDDRHLIQHWLPTDKLIVCQAGWFKAFDFIIINLDHFNDEIMADLPVISSTDHLVGSYTRYIKAIDFNLGMVWLNDGSCWTVYHRDRSWLYDWHPGEIVVIGINKGWGQDLAPYILINRKLRDYVRSSLY